MRAAGTAHPVAQAPPDRTVRRAADGAFWGVLADALLLPTGVITAAYLTRRLGPEGYGLFTLAATLLSWLVWTTVSLVPARAVIKLVSEANDWRPIASLVLRLHLALGLVAAVLLVVAAAPVAGLLGQPALTPYLRLFALEVALFNLAHAHRQVAIGAGLFRRRAGASAARWIARLLLIVLLVELGWSVAGAILGSAGAVLVELAVYRRGIRPSFFGRAAGGAARLLARYVGPLFLSALCVQLASKIDLFALTALGGTAAQAGIYGAAQNLAAVPGLVAAAVAPIVLSSLGRLARDGNQDAARRLARDGLRFAVALLPFAAMTAGAADEIVPWIFGPAFAPAAPILAVLIFGGVAVVAILMATVVPVAADRPSWVIVIGVPALVLALVGHALVIPRYGPIGAAAVTATVLTWGALAAVAVAFRLWRIVPGTGTVVRSLALCLLAYAAAALSPIPVSLVPVKILLISLLIPVGFWLLGEFDASDLALARSVIRPGAISVAATPVGGPADGGATPARRDGPRQPDEPSPMGCGRLGR